MFRASNLGYLNTHWPISVLQFFLSENLPILFVHRKFAKQISLCLNWKKKILRSIDTADGVSDCRKNINNLQKSSFREAEKTAIRRKICKKLHFFPFRLLEIFSQTAEKCTGKKRKTQKNMQIIANFSIFCTSNAIFPCGFQTVE